MNTDARTTRKSQRIVFPRSDGKSPSVLRRLLGMIGPSVRFQKRQFEPARHRLVVEVSSKGRVPPEALTLTTSAGRTISADKITVLSQPGDPMTRWSAEVVVTSIINGELIIAEVNFGKTSKTIARRIKSVTPRHMQRAPVKSHDQREEKFRSSQEELGMLQKALGKAKEQRLEPTVTYFPKFDDIEEFSNHYHRAAWYLTGSNSSVKEVCMGLQDAANPAPRPEDFCEPNGDMSVVKPILDDAQYQACLARSKVVLIWKDIDQGKIEALKKQYPQRTILSVSTGDSTSIEYGNYCEVQWGMLDEGRQREVLDANASILRARLESLRNSGCNKAVVFGTGPSIDSAFSYDFSDCVTIVCNTAITSPALMDHIRPSFICAGDVVSHFGVSKYAEKFRTDLVAFLSERDALLFTTSNFGYLLHVKYPELAHKIILCEQTSAGAVMDLSEVFSLPMLDSTMNIHMLPLAATLSDTIYVLGCDGKNPDADKNEDFWSHSSLAQYHDLVDTGHRAHPSFDVNRQRTTIDRYLVSIEASFQAGEICGKRHFSLAPSYTPPLKARPVPPHMVEKRADGLICLAGDAKLGAARRRVLMVSRASPAHFSGGRYHSLLMAESLARGGDHVVLWLDNLPSWYHNLALIEGHPNIELHINSHSLVPDGDFDLVIAVPDHTPNPALYVGALEVAKTANAAMVLINFESPNWFNAMSPSPKPVDNWRYWFATGAYSDAILSLADIGTEYAREFYTQTHETCVFEAANPVINTQAADIVHAKRIAAEDQIISISRFGKGTEHKNVHAITSLMSEATRGHTLALIVGTGSYPSDEEITQIEAGLAPFDMALKLLHNISDIEKFEEIAKSRCMVFQSLFEGFGYPPIEAQYMDRPCVAYDLPVLREFSDGAITFVPLGDETAMRNALAETLGRDLPADGVLRNRVAKFATPATMDAKMTEILAQVEGTPRAAENFDTYSFLTLAETAFER